MEKSANDLSAESKQLKVDNINKLPKELIIEILDYLNDKLEAAANVCQKWRDIINNTPKINDKLIFYMKISDFNKPDYLPSELDGPIIYRKIHMYDRHDYEGPELDEEKFKKFLLKYKDQIELLEVEHGTTGLMARTMGCLKNLKNLRIERTYKRDDENCQPISLPNLNSLTITQGFNLIKEHNLEEIILTFEDSSADDLSELLMTCHNLKKFNFFGHFEKFKFNNIPFKLKVLDIFSCLNEQSDIELTRTSIIDFLKTQRDCLDKLELYDDGKETKGTIGKAMNYAISEMHLKKLSVGKRGQNDPIGKLQKKTSIKSVKICEFPKDTNEQMNMLGALQGVKKLKLEDAKYYDTLGGVLDRIFKWKETGEFIDTDVEMFFNNIEELVIQYFDCKQLSDFIDFAKFSPNVKFLTLETGEDKIPVYFYNLLTKLKKLECFTINRYSSIVKMTKKNGYFITDVFKLE